MTFNFNFYLPLNLYDTESRHLFKEKEIYLSKNNLQVTHGRGKEKMLVFR